MSDLPEIHETNVLVSAEMIPLSENPAAVFLAGKAATSRTVYESDLHQIATLIGAPNIFNCNWSALRYQHTQMIRTLLIETISPRTGKPLAISTINRMLSALRGTIKTAWLLGQMTAEDYHKAAGVANLTGSALPTGREIPSGEMAALMQVCENDASPAGRRDAALIGVAFGAGLRRTEFTKLDLDDYDPENGRLVVHGKRSKERTTYLPNGAKRAMDDWLSIRGSEPGALFLAIDKAGNILPRRLTPQAIYFILDKRRAEAGIPEFTPHDLRRTFVSSLLDAGADISTVAKLAGHANVTTTARYDRRGEVTKIKAAELLHIPYKGRK
jgi:integrase/recombinase XerD